MKAYQVFKGELDKHGRQHYDLMATYLDKERALAHTKQIAESTPVYRDWETDRKSTRLNSSH